MYARIARYLHVHAHRYMQPLQNEQKDLIKPGEYQSVFSTINMLPPLNAELVGKLEKCKELPPAEQGVGSVFLEMVRRRVVSCRVVFCRVCVCVCVCCRCA